MCKFCELDGGESVRCVLQMTRMAMDSTHSKQV